MASRKNNLTHRLARQRRSIRDKNAHKAAVQAAKRKPGLRGMLDARPVDSPQKLLVGGKG